jgi:hypothetical protein
MKTLIFTIVHRTNVNMMSSNQCQDPDPDQVGSETFRWDPNPSRSCGSLGCDLSCSHSNWNLSCGKSSRSVIPDFGTLHCQIFERPFSEQPISKCPLLRTKLLWMQNLSEWYFGPIDFCLNVPALNGEVRKKQNNLLYYFCGARALTRYYSHFGLIL